MRKFLFSIVFAFTAISTQAQTPAVTMTTTKEVGESCSFYIATKVENTTIQVDWGNGILSNFTVGQSSTLIYGDLTGNTIKVYGEGITELSVLSQYLNNLDASNASTLEILSCSSNNLTTLNLSSNTNLKELYCGSNKLNLLNVTANISLTVLECYSNTLTSLDLSFNTALKNIDCSYNQISTLNLTNNNVLTSVYCAGNQLTLLTLPSSNTLSKVICFNNLLTSLDISGNPNITILDCGNNQISTLELTDHTYLQNIYCNNNLLTTINLLNKPDLYKVDCSNNRFNLSTLPLSQVNWITYNYSPQAKYQLSKDTYSTGEGIDLSSQLTVNSVNTVYTWKTKSGQPLTSGTDYTENNGVFMFNTGQADSLYCEMSNTNFPNLTLTTTTIAVPLPAPAITMTTANEIGSNFSFDIAANTENKTIRVDWGNGATTEHTIGSNWTSISGTIAGSNIQIYGLSISALMANNCNLTSLDVTKCPSIKTLWCAINSLTDLDVTNNIFLEELYCGTNSIVSLDVSKNHTLQVLQCSYNLIDNLYLTNNRNLYNLRCDNNKLTVIDLSKNVELKYFDCYSNNIETIDITNNIKLEEFNCSNNQLLTIDLSKNTALTKLYCTNNKLTSLDFSNNLSLIEIYCAENKLSYSSLPLKLPSWTIYAYTPQAKLTLPKTEYVLNEEIDLNSQLTAGDNTTVYTWKTVGGVTLVKDADYTESNGKFTFLKQPGDYFYCEMTNTTFPDLTLTTENISIPQTEPAITMTTSIPVVSTFSFEIATNVNNYNIQVDWGDGSLSSYLINYTTEITGTLKSNIIKVYGLGIYNLNIINKGITSLDITNCSTLNTIYCGNNQIITLDVTQNTALTALYCNNNQLASLDISKNTALAYLDCRSNKLVTLDVSNNTMLGTLLCTTNDISVLNLSNNTALSNFYCGDNKLTSIDISNNTKLRYFECYANKLSALDLSKNTELVFLNLTDNKFTFASLPVPIASWNPYHYTPQAKFPLPKAEYALNEEIDLSSQLTAGVNTTVYTWKTAGGVTLVKDVDYAESNGKFSFLKTYSDSVYCEMTNATFPDLTLETKNIAIYLPLPTISMVSASAIGSNFYFDINAPENTQITVDFGDGSLSSYTMGINSSRIEGTLRGNTVKIWGKEIGYICVSWMELTSLNVSNAVDLKSLHCNFNQLTSLDISKNIQLDHLYCNNNQLTSLDLSNNINLQYVYNQNNYLTFTTLPMINASWFDFSYSPQFPIKMEKAVYSVGEVLDLSSQLSVNGTVTTYAWVTSSGNTLTKDVDYAENNGKFTFLKGQTETIYCQMTNATFPNLTLETEAISVTLNSPSITLSTTSSTGNTFTFIASASNDNSYVIVDWGNGSTTNHTIGVNESSISGTLAGNTVKVYGNGITMLNVESKNLSELNISGASSLQKILCNNNQFVTLDISKNDKLQYLDCRLNRIETLDLTINIELTYLNCNSNKLSSLDLSKNSILQTLDCQSNQLGTLDVTSNTSLKSLWCSFNNIKTLDLSKNTSLESLLCSNNEISLLSVINNPAINVLRCESNQFKISTLPLKQNSWTTYSYSPQAKVELAKKQYGLTETVDLSSELTVDGKTTSYIWKTKGGATLTAGTDYNVTNGVTTFLKVQADSVYCQMTNTTFPDLTLTTTNIKVSQFPLSVGENEIAVKVYPNPATENFNLEMAEEIVRVEVYTITGVKVFENGLYNSTKVTVPLNKMPKGTLLVKVFTRNGTYKSKVVKI